jgi:hypothetical protein
MGFPGVESEDGGEAGVTLSDPSISTCLLRNDSYRTAYLQDRIN